MADASPHSNTIRAGAFLLSTTVIGLAVVIVLTKSNILASTKQYVVQFQMADGVSGLENGAEVRVSGLKVGRVNAINEQFADGRIDVTIQMDASIPLYKDAQVIRSQPLLGNTSWLNFLDLGTTSAGPLPENGVLAAKPSGGLLATIVGPKNAIRADAMFDDLTAFTGSLSSFAKVQYPEKVVPILNDMASIAADARKDYEGWRTDVTKALSSASDAAGKFDTAMDDAKVMAADARTVVSHFREKNLEQIDRILDDAEVGAASLANALQTLDVEIGVRLPDLRAMLTDLRTAAAQVKLATMEVRRSPWKLLYTPSGGELSRENLYEAARSFALASSDLRVAGETLEAAMRTAPERFKDDPRFRTAVQEQVTSSLTRFQASQQRLFDVLLDGREPPTGSEQAEPAFAPPPPLHSPPPSVSPIKP